MKAQERFNVRSTLWTEVQRPTIAAGSVEGIRVALEGRDAETDNPRNLQMLMPPTEALDLASRLVRAALRRDAEGEGAGKSFDLAAIGKLLLESQQTLVERLLASSADGIGHRVLQNELKQISQELASCQYEVISTVDNGTPLVTTDNPPY